MKGRKPLAGDGVQQPPEVKTCGAQHGANGIALPAFEPTVIHSVVGLDLVSPALREHTKSCVIDKLPRKNERPSDHAPVVLELNA